MNYFAVPGIKCQYRSDYSPVIDEEKILNVVCDYFKIPFKSLLKKDRRRERVFARYCAFLFLKKYTPLTAVKIAKKFSRDHTTILYGLKMIDYWIDNEPPIRNKVADIQMKIFES